METDVLLLKQALGNNRFRLSLMGGFICEIKVPIVSNCSSFMVKYWYRECNRVVHAIMTLGYKFLTEPTAFERFCLVASDISMSE